MAELHTRLTHYIHEDEALAEAELVPPDEVDRTTMPWRETRTFKVSVRCRDGREFHDTVVIRSGFDRRLILPDRPAKKDIDAYNLAVDEQNRRERARLSDAIREIVVKCELWVKPSGEG